MKALIMAGGLGTRLRPLTCNYPKPMVPMVNKPMMAHIVELLKKNDFNQMITILYYQPELIKNYFSDGSSTGIKMDYVEALEDLSTAGSVKNAQDKLKETFLVISGDVLTDFDLSQALKFHKEKKALATMVLTSVKNPLSYGVVITDKEGRVEKFLEKPVWGEVFSDTVNTGIYILEPKVLEYIPENKEYDFSRNLFPLLLENKQDLYGYIASGYWKDIGNLTEYRLTHQDILRGEVTVNIPGVKLDTIAKDIWQGKDCEIDRTVNLKGGVILGNNCQIKAGAQITNSVIGDNCVICEGAKIVNSVLWDNVYVGEEAELKENIIGKSVDIKRRAFLQDGVVIADECVVGEEARIKANVKMWPHKMVEDGATLSTSLVWGEKWAKSLFGAYGITALANIEMTPEFVAKVGAAYGAYLGKNSYVMTSRDSHKASRMINRAFICGLLSSGVNVKDLRAVPIPIIRYTLGTQGEKGGIHVRKSPYDPQLIDIKFFDVGGVDLSFSKEKAIEQLFFREDFCRAQVEETGELSFPSRVIENYKDGFLSALDYKAIKQAHFRVVIDYAFSDAATIFPSILGELGCEVIALNANLDATKITKTADEFAHSLKNLAEVTVALKADAGFLLDTGAEKIFLSSGNGEILSDEMALCLVSLLVLKSNSQSKIAVPVSAPGVIERIASLYSGKVIRTKTTPRAIMELASREEVNFLGDNLGGFIFPHFLAAFDSMFSVGKILEMMARQKEDLNSLISEIPKFNIYKERVPCSWGAKGTVMRNLIQLVKEEGKDFELLDGVKIFQDKEWILLMPDPDKPFFHIQVETSSHEKARNLIEKYKSKIAQWQQ